MSQEHEAGKRLLQQMHNATRQLLVFITCFSLVLASTSVPTVGQSFGGVGGGSSGPAIGGILDGLKLPGQSAEPEPAAPAPSAPQSDLPAEVPADGMEHEAEPDEPPLLLTPGAAPFPDLDERERELLVEALAAEADAFLAAHSLEETPSDIAARIGPKPEALAAWVREKTSLIPYHGLLKGTGGVVRDREGNSLERAALLAEMLGHHGIDARLVRYTLDDAQAQAMLPLADHGAPEPVAAEPARDAEALIQRAAARAGIETELAQQAILALEARLREAALRPQDIFDRAEPVLMHAARSVRLGNSASLAVAERARMAAALSDHFSVEIHSGTGWVRLPLVSIDGDLHETEILAPMDLLSRRDLHHLVSLSVKVAFDDTRRPKELVSILFAASGFDEVPLAVSLLPIDPSDTASITGGLLSPLDMASVTVGKAFERAREGEAPGKAPSIWLPVIAYGADGAKADRAVDLTGEVLESEDLRRRSNAMGAAVDALGGGIHDIARGGNPAGDEERGFAASMIWLEIETTSPGGNVGLSRRLIARIAESAATTADKSLAIAQLGRIRDLQVTTGRPTKDWLGRKTAQAVTALARVDAENVESLSRTTLPNPFFALYRANRWHATQDTRPLFLDRPNIALIESHLRPEGGLRIVFDIIENRVAVRPAQADQAYELRVRQGLADTVAEALFAGPVPERVAHANAALALAFGANGDAEPLRPVDPSQTAFLRWSEGMPETDGLTVLAAGADALHQNWRVDPQAGHVIGGDAMGRGSVYTDYLSRSVVIVGCSGGAGFAVHGGFKAWEQGNYNKAAAYAAGATILAGCAIFGGISIFLLWGSGAVAPAVMAGMVAAAEQWASFAGHLAAVGGLANTGAARLFEPDPEPQELAPVPEVELEDPGDLDLPQEFVNY